MEQTKRILDVHDIADRYGVSDNVAYAYIRAMRVVLYGDKDARFLTGKRSKLLLSEVEKYEAMGYEVKPAGGEGATR